MNLLETVLGAQGGAPVRELARNFGIGEDQATAAVTALLPALAGGLGRNVGQAGGLEGLLGALASGRHSSYLDNPAVLGQASTITDGNSILGHILGSKDVSRQVAARAAGQTGLSQDLLKQMLPIIAAMVMGALSHGARDQGLRPGQTGVPAAGPLDMLKPFLDANRDGSIADDVLGMMGKLFGGR
jgi:hypothetical protein